MVIKDLNEIKNKDITKMSDVELANFRADVIDTEASAEEIPKKKLLKIIGRLVDYFGSFFLVGCLVGIIYPVIETGSIGDNFTLYLLGALLSIAIMITTGIFKSKSQRRYEEIKLVCSTKIIELNRQIAALDYAESLEEAQNTTETEQE